MKAIICFLLLLSTKTIQTQEYFLYVRGEKVELELSDRISIRFDHDMSPDQINTLRSTEPDLLGCEEFESKRNFTCTVNKGTSIKNMILRLRNRSDVETVNPVFKSQNLTATYFDRFVVRFKSEVSSADIEHLCKANNVELIPANLPRNHFYIFKITKVSNRSVLEMANLFYESLPSEWAMPDFYIPARLHGNPNDTYFSNQWYLHNTGQTGGTADADIDAPEAWDISTGASSIVIAVIDEGVSAHEDLPANRLVPGYDYVTNDSDPSPEGNEAHGMATAGIIAASQNNSTGVSGLAPNCKIMPIRIFNHQGVMTSVSNVASAIDFAEYHGARIICNSWGFDYSDPNEPFVEPIREAIDFALNQGLVVVASAGNEANRIGADYHFVEFPANIPGVIAVGATDQFNQIQNYSPRGSSLSVVAPSGGLGIWLTEGVCQPLQTHYYRQQLEGNVWSLDMAGQPGWNPGNYGLCGTTYYNEFLWQAPGGDATSVGNYTAHFGGTSAAAPQVAGVAALILSLKPSLTGSQVRDIILQTADSMGTPGFDSDFGFGRLNAYKAVKAAAKPEITSPAGGESWCNYSQHVIAWSSSPNRSFKIKLLNGDGQPYSTLLASSVTSATNNYSFSWNINSTPSEYCNILVIDNADSTQRDTSHMFTIQTTMINPPSNFYIRQSSPYPVLCWTPAANVSGYYIWRKIDGHDPDFVHRYTINNPSASSYADRLLHLVFNGQGVTCTYKIQSFSACAVSAFTPDKSVLIDPDWLEKGTTQTDHPIPTHFDLGQNYPNPFNPGTTIRYAVPKDVQVTIKLYNALGAEVMTLVNEEKPAGFYEIAFDGSRYASGMYFYRMTAGEFTQTKKLILMK